MELAQWIVAYLLVGLIIALLYTIFQKDVKKKFQEASREKMEQLAENKRLDRGEYSDNRVVYFPKDRSDIWSEAAMNAYRDVDQMSERALATLMFFGLLFFWFFLLISSGLKFIKKKIKS